MPRAASFGGESWTRSGSSIIPRAFPPRSTSTITRRSAKCSRRASAGSRIVPPTVHGQDDHVPRARHAVGRVRRVPAGERLREGHARRADDAQHPAVSGEPVRHAARGLHGGQRQPAVHRARARAPARRLRRGGDRRRREFRADRAGGARQDQGPHGDRHQHRRAPGVQGHHRRPRAAPREKDDPGVEAAGVRPVLRRAGGGPRRQARAGADRPRRHRLPAIHRRHDGRGEGRGAPAPQHHRQPAAGPRVAAAVPGRLARSHHHAVAALSHLLADGELPHVHDAGRRERADSESARHPRLHRGDGQVQVHGVHRRQHALQCAREQSGVREARLLVAQDDPGRRDGGAGGGRRQVEGDHRLPADRSLRPDGDLAGGDDQPARPARLQRLDRAADPVDRDRAARRRGQGRAARANPGRSASAARR